MHKRLVVVVAAASACLALPPPAYASAWTVALAAGSHGTGQSGTVSVAVNGTCTATDQTNSCGTANLLPAIGSSSAPAVADAGTGPSAYGLTSTSCGAATVTDTAATQTVAHGGFTAASYRVLGPHGGYSVAFDGSSTWYGTGGVAASGPQAFTELAWFKTSSSAGGPLMGFQSTYSPNGAGSADRSVWLDNSGKVVAGVNPTGASPQEAASSSAYNNGAWHLAALSVASTGMSLYVDGGSVAANSSGNGGQVYAGWWSIGAAQLGSWSDAPTLDANNVGYFNGNLAGLAILPSALSAAQVSGLYSSATFAAYASAVASDSPSHYWGLQDTAPTAATASTATLPGQQPAAYSDLSGNDDTATVAGGVTATATGPLSAVGSAAFDGTSGYLTTAGPATAPTSYTQLVWFKSSASTGQPIIWFGNNQNPGATSTTDRNLQLNSSGNVQAYVYNGSGNTLTTAGAYDDGAWHLAAATLSSAGFDLYVDGALQTSNTAVTSASTYSGSTWWSIGAGSSLHTAITYFKGSLAGAAIIPTALTSAQISSLYSSPSFGAYTSATLGDSPTYYWPLTSQVLTYPDVSGSGSDGTSIGGVSTNSTGPLGAGGSVAFDGATGYLLTAKSSSSTAAYTQAAWFKTTSSAGGPLMGFSITQLPAASQGNAHDRYMWLDTSGHVWAGGDHNHEVESTGTYNDGVWHLAVVTVSASGLSLYLDGALASNTTSETAGDVWTGYWTIGNAEMASWNNAPTLNSSGVGYFTGSIAGVAVAATALSSAQISALYSAATFTSYTSLALVADSSVPFWPLTSPPTGCNAALVTASITVGSTTTCLTPQAAAGTACPAVAGGGLPLVDLTTGAVDSAVTQSPGATATVTITLADNGTLPTALSGVDILTDATISAATGNWTAAADYVASHTQL